MTYNKLMFRRDQHGAVHLLILTLLLVAIGGAGYFVYKQKQTKPAAQTSQTPTKNFDKFWQGRIDAALADTKCPQKPQTSWNKDYYKGPLIDAHYHIPPLPDSGPGDNELPKGNGDTNTQPLLGINSTISRIVCTLEREGTKKVLAWFAVYPEIDKQSVEVTRLVMAKYPKTFIPFIMPPDDDGSPTGSPTVDAKTLKKMLSYEPGLFKGYGEIGLYARSGGAKALPPDSLRLQKIYKIVRKNKLLVYFHLGEGMQASFEKTAKANRDINFLFHGDQLVTYQSDGSQNLSRLDQILSRNPNVYYGVDELYGDDFILKPEVGEKEFLAHFNNYEPLLAEDVATWKAFIERHPNQVIWGTDRGWSSPWSMDYAAGRQLTDYVRAFIARLDPDVQAKYAYQNVERLLQSN